MNEETDMTSANARGEDLPRPVHVKPVPRSLAVAMAALCVAVGILLAIVDDTGDGGRAPDATGPAPAVSHVPDSAATHRKQVFDARRARFDAARGSSPDPAVRH